MQLMPGTAKELGVDPTDMLQNAVGGAVYLKRLYSHYGNWPETLSAYNAGPGNVTKGKGVPNIPETKAYVQSIMSMINSF
jgi:soluble lytic murein transglycosylase-like protein